MVLRSQAANYSYGGELHGNLDPGSSAGKVMTRVLLVISACLSAAAVVTLVAGACATVGYFVSTAAAVLAGIFGAGIDMFSAGVCMVCQ